MKRIFLNKNKSKDSVNKEKNINVNFNCDNRLLPLINIESGVNAYEQYVKEKKESQTYRLSFNITPICSNILFNKVSEIIYHEGAEDCVVFGENYISGDPGNIATLTKYCKYKETSYNTLRRHGLIRDTGFSHPECGGLVYHCGYDIFNNHTLRKKEFNVVNKLNETNKEKNNFNTIYDFKRDYDGNNILNYSDNLEYGSNKKTFDEHLYTQQNILSFENSINENLVEKNGWVGFINPNGLNIPNYNSISLNKCLNNNNACEMVDMYPDRSLFSFTPKINKYRENRLEYNWDYCLTYPFENFYDNMLVQHICYDGTKVNGLKAVLVNDLTIDELINFNDDGIITLKTYVKNNFKVNSLLNIILIGINNEDKEIIVPLENNERVVRLGYEGKNNEYYFSIYADEIIEKLYYFKNINKIDIRVRKVNNGGISEYYFRKFRRIPNFNNSDVYNDGYVDTNEIKKYSSKNFNSTINNLAFSKTIYNDRNVQILYNDNINLKGLKDNLGRDISEIYLTIVKNNEGYKEWYYNKDYCNKNIKASHCFGKVTSGVNILDDNFKDYNIHKIHNIPTSITNYNEYENVNGWKTIVEHNYSKLFNKEYDENGNVLYSLPKVLEDDINNNGVIINGERNNEFFGDIVEFNKNELNETVLEEVLHRVNTAQREILDEEFRNIIVDEIIYDDYDLESGFTVSQKFYNEMEISNDDDETTIKLPINIEAEGYYYKPHYKIQLKKYKNSIKQGEHTRIIINSFFNLGDNKYKIVPVKNYFLTMNTTLYFYHKETKTFISGLIISKGTVFNEGVTIKVDLADNTNFSDYIIYKPNSEKPYGAYELNDGTGRYLWKELLEEHEYFDDNEISKYIFTNNAHYINKHIVFYLHRQDPDGKKSLSNTTNITPITQNLSIEGVVNDYSNFENMINEIEEGGLLC